MTICIHSTKFIKSMSLAIYQKHSVKIGFFLSQFTWGVKIEMPYSRVRCKTPRQDLQQGVVENWDFPIAEHQSPAFEAEGSWRWEQDCQGELLVCWESSLPTLTSRKGRVLPPLPEVRRESLWGKLVVGGCSWGTRWLGFWGMAAESKRQEGTAGLLQGFFCQRGFLSPAQVSGHFSTKGLTTSD